VNCELQLEPNLSKYVLSQNTIEVGSLIQRSPATVYTSPLSIINRAYFHRIYWLSTHPS